MKLDASNNIIKRSDLEEILIEWLNKLKRNYNGEIIRITNPI